jgi:hypothetical protein
MLDTSPARSRELIRLHREILTTLRIQNPGVQRSDALNNLIRDTLSTFAHTGMKERELTRMTLITAQKFINQLSPASVEI